MRMIVMVSCPLHCPEYGEKLVPSGYSDRRGNIDGEEIDEPEAGFLWTLAKKAGPLVPRLRRDGERAAGVAAHAARPRVGYQAELSAVQRRDPRSGARRRLDRGAAALRRRRQHAGARGPAPAVGPHRRGQSKLRSPPPDMADHQLPPGRNL